MYLPYSEPPIPEYALDATREHEAELEMVLVLADELKYWTKELKQIDDALSLVWAPEHVTAPGLVPGRYHVLERRPFPTPPNLIPLTAEDGSFREPGSWMFDMLRRNSYWNDQAVKDRAKRETDMQAARDRARKREREDMIDEFDDRLKAILNPGVSFANTGKGWTNRAGTRRQK